MILKAILFIVYFLIFLALLIYTSYSILGYLINALRIKKKSKILVLVTTLLSLILIVLYHTTIGVFLNRFPGIINFSVFSVLMILIFFIYFVYVFKTKKWKAFELSVIWFISITIFLTAIIVIMYMLSLPLIGVKTVENLTGVNLTLG